MHNKIAQKLLSITVSAALMTTMVPRNGVFAESDSVPAEPTTLVTSASANDWGRSDLRAWLNNGLGTIGADGTVSDKTFGIDSTSGPFASDNSSGYASYFTDAEYAHIVPTTYSVACPRLWGSGHGYYLTDEIFLASGDPAINFENDFIPNTVDPGCVTTTLVRFRPFCIPVVTGEDFARSSETTKGALSVFRAAHKYRADGRTKTVFPATFVT